MKVVAKSMLGEFLSLFVSRSWKSEKQPGSREVRKNILYVYQIVSPNMQM